MRRVAGLDVIYSPSHEFEGDTQMQPGYPPPRGHQGYPQGAPGYPGQPFHPHYPPPPKKSNTGLIVTLCVVGFVLLSGLGVGAWLLIDANSDGPARTAAAPAPSSAAGPPDRFTEVPTCGDVERGVTGLPEKMTDEPTNHGSSDPDTTTIGHSCLWDSGDSPIRVELSYYLATSLPGKSGAGADWASRYYDGQAEQGSPGPPVDVPGADKAARTSFSTDDCGIHVLVGNVYVSARYYADTDASVSTATCESDSLKVATAAVGALRP